MEKNNYHKENMLSAGLVLINLEQMPKTHMELRDWVIKKSKDKDKAFHSFGAGATCWVIWQITTIIGIFLGSIIPEKLGLSFAVPLTFLALIVDDLRKLINVIVIIISGLIATLGYEIIPFKAYVIVAAISGLIIATILTKFKGLNNG